MKRHLITLAAIYAGCVVLAAGSVIEPWPRKFYSANGKYCIHVTPPKHALSSPGMCRGDLYRIDGNKKQKMWTRYFPNNGAPTHVFLSDDGKFIVTIADWSDRGFNIPVFVYHENFLIHAFTPEELGTRLGAKTKAFFGPKEEHFVILAESSRPIVFDRWGKAKQAGDFTDADWGRLLDFIQKRKTESKFLPELLEEQDSIGRDSNQ